MNESHIVFGLILASAGIQSAYAQPNVEMYGSIDVALEYVSNANLPASLAASESPPSAGCRRTGAA